jgi:hypothetical protein
MKQIDFSRLSEAEVTYPSPVNYMHFRDKLKINLLFIPIEFLFCGIYRKKCNPKINDIQFLNK